MKSHTLTTQLGKELRKLRIDIDATLLDLSKLVNYSPSLISAIETGKCPPPADFLDALCAKVPEARKNRRKFEALIHQAKNEIRISLADKSLEDSMLASDFAKKLSILPISVKQELRMILSHC